MSNNLIELRLKREALHKRLDLVNHQIDEAVERQYEKQQVKAYEDGEGLFLNNDDLHKLLSYLEHTIVSDEEISDKSKRKLIDFSHELMWDIAEKFGYDLNEGTVEPSDFRFKTH